MNLKLSDFCESHCPVCTNARKGNRFARILQRIEMVVTFGGCPAGRARKKEYGVRPDEAIPVQMPDKASPPTPSGDTVQ